MERKRSKEENQEQCLLDRVKLRRSLFSFTKSLKGNSGVGILKTFKN